MNLYAICIIKKRCYSYKSSKTSIESWNDILKSTQSNSVINEEAWLKPYIEINTKLKTEAKNDFEKDFFKLINSSVFGKTMENVRKHRDIKLVATDKRIDQLVLEPNYHTTKWFSEDLLQIELKKVKVKMNKPVYLGLQISEISMYEFWYDYNKTKISRQCKSMLHGY